MNSEVFKYVGFLNQNYTFVDRNGKTVNFAKCRKDLIEIFKLNNDENINEWFKINYFVTQPQNHFSDNEGIYIVSDMEILKQ
ncbi:MAG: hypothetical protein ISQ99_06585 [Flavobacteriales bacterium]|nr:hypothetical protein [Flavobacteriales bacterium]MBL6869722.1 hypothetical protein [Flavobacteriales bacterium]